MSIHQEGWDGFLKLLLSFKDKKSLSLLLDLFLTSEEKESLAMRFLIIKELLREEKTQREMAKDIGVSIAKITRGSNELKRMNPALVKLLKEKL